MERIDDNRFRLSTGREFTARMETISLYPAPWPDGEMLEVVEGFEAGLNPNADSVVRCDDWTSDERAELADFMIERWQQFKRAQSTLWRSCSRP